MPDQDRVPKPLTLAFVRRVTAPGRYYDRDGLILTVSPAGGKSWTQRLTIQGRRRDIGLGSAHVVTPAQARALAAKNKAVARTGGNPLVSQAAPRKREDGAARAITFAALSATRYRRLRAAPGALAQAKETYQRIRLHANPVLGRLPVAEITEDGITRTLLAMAEKSRTTARWLRTNLAPIFDEAVEEGLRTDNPVRTPAVADLPELEPLRVVKEDTGRQALEQLPDFLRQIEQDTRRPASFLLIRFCLLTARTPAECRLATWRQMDLVQQVWRFPKMQKPNGSVVEKSLHEGHLAILRRVRAYAVGGPEAFFFPSRQGINEAFVDPSISMSLRRAGYDLLPRDFLRAHKSWVATEGGDPQDLWAWWERLRQELPTEIEGSAVTPNRPLRPSTRRGERDEHGGLAVPTGFGPCRRTRCGLCRCSSPNTEPARGSTAAGLQRTCRSRACTTICAAPSWASGTGSRRSTRTATWPKSPGGGTARRLVTFSASRL